MEIEALESILADDFKGVFFLLENFSFLCLFNEQVFFTTLS